MSLLRIAYDFAKLSDPRLLERANFNYQQISTQTADFPNPSPSMAVLRQKIDNFRSAVTAATDGGPLLKSQKNLLGEDLVETLYLLSYYVLFIAQGDVYTAMKSGFTLARPSSPLV